MKWINSKKDITEILKRRLYNILSHPGSELELELKFYKELKQNNYRVILIIYITIKL